MTINTKYNIGNLVWFLDNRCHPQQAVVTRVMYAESKSSTEEEYCLLYPADKPEYEQVSVMKDVCHLGRSREDLKEILNSYFD